jgi:hypothetical protein
LIEKNYEKYAYYFAEYANLEKSLMQEKENRAKDE